MEHALHADLVLPRFFMIINGIGYVKHVTKYIIQCRESGIAGLGVLSMKIVIRAKAVEHLLYFYYKTLLLKFNSIFAQPVYSTFSS